MFGPRNASTLRNSIVVSHRRNEAPRRKRDNQAFAKRFLIVDAVNGLKVSSAFPIMFTNPPTGLLPSMGRWVGPLAIARIDGVCVVNPPQLLLAKGCGRSAGSSLPVCSMKPLSRLAPLFRPLRCESASAYFPCFPGKG